jgi:hypothetical protein
MIFGGTMDGYQDRYASFEQALLYHELVVGQVEEIAIWRHALANIRRDLRDWWQRLRWEVRSWFDESELTQGMARILNRS